MVQFVPQVDDGFNLLRINVQDAIKDGTLQYLASTYNVSDQMVYMAYMKVEEKSKLLPTYCNTSFSSGRIVARNFADCSGRHGATG
jgi:hypothetical protein